MKKSFFKFPLVILLLSAVIISQPACKKYEEGPSLSLRSKKSRVANTWKAEKAELNGVNVTELFEDVTYTFEKSGSYIISSPSYGSDAGTWEFVSDKEEIKLTDSDGDASTWKILRLKDKELWVSEESDGEKAEIHFVEK